MRAHGRCGVSEWVGNEGLSERQADQRGSREQRGDCGHDTTAGGVVSWNEPRSACGGSSWEDNACVESGEGEWSELGVAVFSGDDGGL